MPQPTDSELSVAEGGKLAGDAIAFNRGIEFAINDRRPEIKGDPMKETRVILAARFAGELVERLMAGEADPQLLAYLAIAHEATVFVDPRTT